MQEQSPPPNRNRERAELHKTIWEIATQLRGTIDGWDFKAYVLGLLFYRFISEDLTVHLNQEAHAEGDLGFDYATTVSDQQAQAEGAGIVDERGFFIKPSELFVNVQSRAKNDPNLNETLARVFADIEASSVGTASEASFKGLFGDIDVNSNKLGATVTQRNERLVKLLSAIKDLPLGRGHGKFSSHNIDLFGDAYEFLMGMYAANAGKSGGEYFTPQEVSELLVKLAIGKRTSVKKVYDPACGSGSLLLKAKKVLENEQDLKFYGQENNLTTYNLCRINMFLHGINYVDFKISHGDTLISPSEELSMLAPFDTIVSNPPYSTHWEGDSNPLLIRDARFSPAGVLAPKSKADLAFTMHMVSLLASNGTAAIVEFPGVLYRSGAEQKIRQYLVENNLVEAIIQLPSNLFFGTSIATCILVLKKNRNTTDVLFIDASKEFQHSGNKNVLSADKQDKIFQAFIQPQTVPGFSKVARLKEIKEQGFNLSVSTYVESNDQKEVIDISLLNKEIQTIVAKQTELRQKIDGIVGDLENGKEGKEGKNHE